MQIINSQHRPKQDSRQRRLTMAWLCPTIRFIDSFGKNPVPSQISGLGHDDQLSYETAGMT